MSGLFWFFVGVAVGSAATLMWLFVIPDFR